MKDQLGHQIKLPHTPKRIVSLVPSQTELLYDLGLQDEIVAITKFCVHPQHLRTAKAVVGGTKRVNFDKIRALKPDIIVANKEENTREMVDGLRKIAPVWVSDIATFDDNLQFIACMGELFNRHIEAQKWIDKITAAKTGFEGFVSDKPVRKAAYFIWKAPWMAAGSETYIDDMLKICRLENIYANRSRYPEVDIEKLRLEGDPEIILLSSEPYSFKDADVLEIERHTRYAKTVLVDGEMFSWYGSRAAKAFDYFRGIYESRE